MLGYVNDDMVTPVALISASVAPLLLRLKFVCSSVTGSVADAESQKITRNSPGPSTTLLVLGMVHVVLLPPPVFWYWSDQPARLTVCCGSGL